MYLCERMTEGERVPHRHLEIQQNFASSFPWFSCDETKNNARMSTIKRRWIKWKTYTNLPISDALLPSLHAPLLRRKQSQKVKVPKYIP